MTADDKRQAPVVSVIIPCFNQAHFLSHAIESAIAQNVPLEIIVIDDGSTDDTPEQVRRYPQVSYHYQENRGLSAARNSGMVRSRGEYLVFLDADDALLPQAISINARILDSNPNIAFAAGHYRYVDADGRFLHENKYHGITKDHYLNLLIDNYIGMHGAVMYRRSALESCGGFDTSLRVCEDYAMYLKICKTHPVVCHSAVIAEYRRHGNGLSNNSSLMLKTAHAILRSEGEFIEQRNDEMLLSAYRRGTDTWRNRYGRELALKIGDNFRNGRWAIAWRQSVSLLPHMPKILVWVGRRMVMKWRRQFGSPPIFAALLWLS